MVHKIALWAQNRWSYNPGGLKIKGCKIDEPLYSSVPGSGLWSQERPPPHQAPWKTLSPATWETHLTVWRGHRSTRGEGSHAALTNGDKQQRQGS